MFSVSEPSSNSTARSSGEHAHFPAPSPIGSPCPKFRLASLREPDALGIAAAFEVEDAILATSHARHRRSGGAGSADSVVLPVPESPKNSAVSPCSSHIRRAMHRHDALQRQHIVEHAEHRLLHFPRVGSSPIGTMPALMSQAMTVGLSLSHASWGSAWNSAGR